MSRTSRRPAPDADFLLDSVDERERRHLHAGAKHQGVAFERSRVLIAFRRSPRVQPTPRCR
jgi:hypothetical protein